jgi:hypothetical protein
MRIPLLACALQEMDIFAFSKLLQIVSQKNLWGKGAEYE